MGDIVHKERPFVVVAVVVDDVARAFRKGLGPKFRSDILLPPIVPTVITHLS
jgi:hypothetical protein